MNMIAVVASVVTPIRRLMILTRSHGLEGDRRSREDRHVWVRSDRERRWPRVARADAHQSASILSVARCGASSTE